MSLSAAQLPTSNTLPCVEKWYDDFFLSVRKGNFHHNNAGAKRLATGMGLTDAEKDTMMQVATELLPADGRVLVIKNKEDRLIQEDAARRLYNDVRIQPFFVRNVPGNDEQTRKFFNEAPVRWIACANDKRRKEQAAGNNTTNADPQGNGGTTTTTATEPQQHADEARYEPENNLDAVNDPGSTLPQPLQLVFDPDVLQIKDIRYATAPEDPGYSISLSMSGLFSERGGPFDLYQIRFRAVQAVWNREIGLRDDVDVRFVAVFGGGNLPVDDDEGLRSAYRLWAGLGPVEPLVFYVA